MSESTLSIDRDEILSEMAHVASWSRTAADWDTKQTARLDIVLKRAMREAYFPENGHDWNFLKPVSSLATWRTIAGIISSATYDASTYTTIVATTSVFHSSDPGHSFVVGSNSYTIDSYTSGTTILVVGDASAESGAFSVTGDDTYRAPDNFDSLVGGRIMYAADSNRNRSWIDQVASESIEQLRSDEVTGSPHSFAIVPVLNTAGQQRWDFVFYPEPDASYNLKMRTRVTPNVLTAAAPYPYGPTWFAKVLLAAARSEMEMEIYKAYGAHRAAFDTLLAAAQVRDRRTSAQSLGPMQAPMIERFPQVGFREGITLNY